MRIWDNQPQMHFTKSKPIIVKSDCNIKGDRLSGYEYRQGNDYMILPNLKEADYLIRMGYQVEIIK